MPVSSSEAWQRFVVRGMRNPVSIIEYIMILLILLSIIDNNNFINSLAPNLSQMERQSGVVEKVYKTGKSGRVWMDLRLDNGKILKYEFLITIPESIDKLRGLVGESVNVWGNKRFSLNALGFKFGFVRDLMQVKIKDNLVFDYEKDIRPYMEKYKNRGWTIYLGDIVALLVIAFFLAHIWTDNKAIKGQRYSF